MVRHCLPGLLLAVAAAAVQAQPLLYSQHLPEGTVYVRLASALPAAATVTTDFTGAVALGNTDAARISPYFVAGDAGGKTVSLQVNEGGKAFTATISRNPAPSSLWCCTRRRAAWQQRS